MHIVLNKFGFSQPRSNRGFERNLRSFLERCLIGICLSIMQKSYYRRC